MHQGPGEPPHLGLEKGLGLRPGPQGQLRRRGRAQAEGHHGPVGQEGEVGVPAFPKGNALWSSEAVVKVWYARRVALRRAYPSDLTDEEWAILEPLIPAPKPGGRPTKVPRREIVNAILHVLKNGIQWRAMPRHAAGVRS